MPILRFAEVTRVTGLSRSTTSRRERRGDFPSRIRLGPNSVGWSDDEVRKWIDERPRGMVWP